MNSVWVCFRVDGGFVQSLPARELRRDATGNVQYFGCSFPSFPTGELVEYAVVLSCAGRQVPASVGPFQACFCLQPRAAAHSEAALAYVPSRARFEARLEFCARIHVQFEEPQYVADTPAGVRVNYFVREGTAIGPQWRARVLPGACDFLIVRRDGMGLARVRSALVTEDGAGIDLEMGGYLDLGADGYRCALNRALPDRAPFALSPLISTRHAKYRWLNRIQCIGIGETRLATGQLTYDLYSVTPPRG
jgi:hypothetical protein